MCGLRANVRKTSGRYNSQRASKLTKSHKCWHQADDGQRKTVYAMRQPEEPPPPSSALVGNEGSESTTLWAIEKSTTKKSIGVGVYCAVRVE